MPIGHHSPVCRPSNKLRRLFGDNAGAVGVFDHGAATKAPDDAQFRQRFGRKASARR